MNDRRTTNPDANWVTVAAFARYLGVSPDTAYRMTRTDPEVARITHRVGRRVLVCLRAWKEGYERRMIEGPAA